MGSNARSIAAVDLGSNSFHMVVGRLDDGGIRVVDKLRERVQLAAGLDQDGYLSAEAMERALACLERFGQRINELSAKSVRALGTNTLRQAKNGAYFVAEAERALGHRIDIISGQEEARLVYRGVIGSVPPSEETRLVIDIGGGSTECILGRGDAIVMAESLAMGCVVFTRRFFPKGRIDEQSMKAAQFAAALELRPIRYAFRDAGWSAALGSSGTILAIARIAQAMDASETVLTPNGMARLRTAILAARRIDKLAMPGLSTDRASVLPGGFAILEALFDSLKMSSISAARGALREGALADLAGRMGAPEGDVRHAAVRGLLRRASVDRAQAARVRETALTLYDQAAGDGWIHAPRGRLELGWAAELHELGSSFTHTDPHKLGAYLIQNADLSGFSRADQALVATLVRTHRGKLSKELFANLSDSDRKLARRLAALLRLASRLHRNRSEHPLPPVKLEIHRDRLDLCLPRAFLDRHPLTAEDLRSEGARLATLGFEFVAH